MSVLSASALEAIEPRPIEVVGRDRCPECGAVLVHHHACVVCSRCGYSRCG